MVGDVFDYNKEVVRKRHYWLLGIKVKNAAKHSIMHRIGLPLSTKNIHPTNANSTEIEMLWFKMKNPKEKHSSLFVMIPFQYSVHFLAAMSSGGLLGILSLSCEVTVVLGEKIKCLNICHDANTGRKKDRK